MSKESELPQKLYKYKSFDKDEYYKKLLSKNSIFFASPKHFNDPFDCNIFPNYDIGSNKEILNKFINFAKIDFPDLPYLKQVKIARSNFKENINFIKSPKLLAEKYKEFVNSRYGICSLSEVNNNLLMWAHYSSSHTGFCVEIDTAKMKKIFINYAKILNELLTFEKIKYKSNYPITNPFLKEYANDSQYIDAILTKSKDWKYEKEWRIIYFDSPNKTLEFPDDIIAGVYFGVNCLNENIDSSIRLFEGKKHIPNFYKAELKEKQFGIDFNQI